MTFESMMGAKNEGVTSLISEVEYLEYNLVEIAK